MRGVASTNVMTTNTSQVAIDATQLAWSWLLGHDESPEMAHQREVCRRRLRDGLPLPLAFLAGTLVGAFAFASAGSLALVAPGIVVGGLMLWAARRPGTIPTPDRPCGARAAPRGPLAAFRYSRPRPARLRPGLSAKSRPPW
jgi:uncharacterized membrane protein YoaK (UPF0700 family)